MVVVLVKESVQKMGKPLKRFVWTPRCFHCALPLAKGLQEWFCERAAIGPSGQAGTTSWSFAGCGVLRKSGLLSTYKIHLLTIEHKAVHCGWQLSALKAQDLNPIDHQSDPESHQECARCFRHFAFPSDWPVDQGGRDEDSELSS